MAAEAASAPALIGGEKTCSEVTRDVCAPLEGRPTRLWWGAFLASAAVLALAVATLGKDLLCFDSYEVSFVFFEVFSTLF